MHKTWLHTNRRALALGAIPVALMFAVSSGIAMSVSGWMFWISAGVSAVAGYLVSFTIYLIFRPRLAYDDGSLMVYMRPGAPIRVPIDVVECFFLGQGPSLVANPLRTADDMEETATIVIRLAEAAEDWKNRDVRPAIGLWCDGYITIRGTWCEPIDGELLQQLNRLVAQAHRESREAKEKVGQEVR